jgi:hypothetical protein
MFHVTNRFCPFSRIYNKESKSFGTSNNLSLKPCLAFRKLSIPKSNVRNRAEIAGKYKASADGGCHHHPH